MSATPAMQIITEPAEPGVSVPDQAVFDDYLRRAKALADELGVLLGGSAEVSIGIHRANPERYHALPHPPTLRRESGPHTHVIAAWRTVANIGINTSISVWCRENYRYDGPGSECGDVAAARVADALDTAAEAARKIQGLESFGGGS